MLAFPSQNSAFYDFVVSLDNVPYLITIFYSEREDRYYMSIGLPDSSSPIISGIKIVPNFDLLGNYTYLTSLPAGAIIAMSNSADDTPPGLGELGSDARVTLYYLTAQEMSTGVLNPLPK